MPRKNETAATSETTDATPATTENQDPAGAPVDSAETPSTTMQEDVTVESAKEQDNALKAEKDPDTGEVHATLQVDAPINPSSTYPGRNTELAENDMRIPTEIDLAKRAKFAGSQIPARVHAAGLVDGEGNINVDVEEAPEASKE